MGTSIAAGIGLWRAVRQLKHTVSHHRSSRRCNLSTVALSCLMVSYLQLAVGNFMLSSRDDGTYFESPEPAPVPRRRIATINEQIARWFVADLTNIPTWIAYVLCYYFWKRLTMPVMTQQSSTSFGTPRQMIILAIGTTVYALVCILGIVDDDITTVYWVRLHARMHQHARMMMVPVNGWSLNEIGTVHSVEDLISPVVCCFRHVPLIPPLSSFSCQRYCHVIAL